MVSEGIRAAALTVAVTVVMTAAAAIRAQQRLTTDVASDPATGGAERKRDFVGVMGVKPSVGFQ